MYNNTDIYPLPTVRDSKSCLQATVPQRPGVRDAEQLRYVRTFLLFVSFQLSIESGS